MSPAGHGFLDAAVVDDAAAGFFSVDFGFFGSRLLRFCPLAMSVASISRARSREAADFFPAGADDRRNDLIAARCRRPAALFDQRTLVPGGRFLEFAQLCRRIVL